MHLKCFYAQDIYKNININIINEVGKILPVDFIYNLFIAKLQQKVPDYLVIIMNDNDCIGVFTIYIKSDSMTVDNFVVPNISSSQFCVIILEIWKFIQNRFIVYMLRFNFQCLKINFNLDSSMIDFKHIDMQNVKLNNGKNIWYDVIEISQHLHIYITKINTALLSFAEYELGNPFSIPTNNPPVDKTLLTTDDIIAKFNLDISLSNESIDETAVLQGKSLGLILAYSKLESSLFDSTGIGCFAGKSFKRKDEICRFQGKIISQQQREQYANKNRGFWCIDLGGGKFITPSNKCCANYINSPLNCFINGKACRSNAKLVVDKRNKVARVVASQNIHPGTEILMSYGKSYDMNPKQLLMNVR